MKKKERRKYPFAGRDNQNQDSDTLKNVQNLNEHQFTWNKYIAICVLMKNTQKVLVTWKTLS